MQKGSFKLMKQLNEQIILQYIRDYGPISRAEIAKKTKLTPATVSKIVSQLLEAEFILETKEGESSGGRRPILLTINPVGGFIIGLTISKGEIEVLLTDLEINYLDNEKLKLETIDFHAICDHAADLIKDVIIKNNINSERVLGVGVGLHGMVNYKEGISIFAPHLKWRNLPLKQMLVERLDYPVLVDNDVRLMALGEMWKGESQNLQNFAYINVDYGVGTGIVLGGNLLRGENYSAGEIGHTLAEVNGPLCSCGKHGCLEALISLGALSEEDEPIVREKVSRYLGRGLANLNNLLDLERIILGGRVLELASDMIPDIREEFSTHVFFKADKEKIAKGNLGSEASIVGAVTMILSEFYQGGNL